MLIENLDLLEELYRRWKNDPQSVDVSWSWFFEGFELGGCSESVQPAKGSWLHMHSFCECENLTPLLCASQSDSKTDYRLKQAMVYKMIFAYRIRGHAKSNLDPLGLTRGECANLNLSYFGFTEADLETRFDTGQFAGGGERTLREIVSLLEKIYCGNIGFEYMHVQDFEMRHWLRDRIEAGMQSCDSKRKIRILNRLLDAEFFEKFLHTRYVGQKRFSLEGGETLIPILDAVIEQCPARGVEQIVMGMTHRGRLNVLANIFRKSYQSIFSEFAENFIPEAVLGDGDVRYHVGYESVIKTDSGEEIMVSLAPNSSHLEAVCPVVQGKTRARQRILRDTEKREKVIPVLIHGDAALVGQGIVMETLNLSQLEGYRTGGTIHIVINNQIGFTTIPKDARSTMYCTAFVKGLDVPVFHVNGDDPLAALHAMELALEFRQKFKQDVAIDLVCYRRHGHNEGDEPSFTQPSLYSEIEKKKSVSRIFMESILATGDITQEESDKHTQQFNDMLNRELSLAQEHIAKFRPTIRESLSCPQLLDPVETAVSLEQLRQVGVALTTEPPDMTLNPKVAKLLQHRRAMVEGQVPVDWGCAEALAFGTLLAQNIPIRLSGQDSRRGTFSHRHACLFDLNGQKQYIPLKNVAPDQASFCVYNSPLSEAAVLGFDYGYSLNNPDMLILWEAQFGDFANGAQTIIDSYITSAESKWGNTSKIVLLLPHGYHGMGADHSSARLERFLQSCAEDNIQVAQCTTPANYFHILRRQGLRRLRKPLILLTPKGLLRDTRATSSLEDFTQGQFQEIIPDAMQNARKAIFCSGKIYYDLSDYRQKNQIPDTALIRIEQFYPLHEEKLKNVFSAHPNAEKIIWCQEESRNMGAWSYIEPRLRALFGREILYAGRDASASPATGMLAVHELEQKDVVEQAFRC
ncbi:MAG: 2-oxoglutarate dehydrogenase E1 component [Verrucomicrobiota bacterium]